MIDAGVCDVSKLSDAQLVYDVLNQLPEKIGMTRMTLPYVVKWQDKWAEIPGYSGFVMIAESHISIHTFPQERYVFIDLFSCREFDIETAKAYLIEAFGAKKVTCSFAKRGLDFPRNVPVEQ